MQPVIPFHTFLWKVASRCNINCSYCYIYNSADSSWKRQPALISLEVARRAAIRIREHLLANHKNDAAIIFHGGEPLLLGLQGLRQMIKVIIEEFRGTGIHLNVGMQSNLLLLTDEIAAFLKAARMSIGVSCDGPPPVNNTFRLDHNGVGTAHLLEDKLRLITQSEFEGVFSGFLTVMNTETDPKEILDYLLQFSPPSIDFLFPLNNHDRQPPNKPTFEDAPYGRWLIDCFDHWLSTKSTTRIRIFDSIIQMLTGSSTSVESLGPRHCAIGLNELPFSSC